MYLDSGAFWCISAAPIFYMLGVEDIYVTSLPLAEKQFTKKYTFEYMNCMCERYIESSQIQGTIIIGLRKTDKSIGLMTSFLKFCGHKELFIKFQSENIVEEANYESIMDYKYCNSQNCSSS